MAHIRRHFEQALDENKSAAEFALGEIQKLYQIERNCTETNMSDAERKQKRNELARPIMEHLYDEVSGRWLVDNRQQSC